MKTCDATFFVDSKGAMTSDVGFSLSSPVHTALWQGNAVAPSGMTQVSYEINGQKGQREIAYDTSAVNVAATPVIDVPGPLANVLRFVADVKSASAQPGGLRASPFEVAVVGQDTRDAPNGRVTMIDNDDGFAGAECVFGVVGTYVAAATVIAGCVLVTLACIGLIMLAYGVGFFTARTCGYWILAQDGK